jgi:hypothetical protein
MSATPSPLTSPTAACSPGPAVNHGRGTRIGGVSRTGGASPGPPISWRAGSSSSGPPMSWRSAPSSGPSTIGDGGIASGSNTAPGRESSSALRAFRLACSWSTSRPARPGNWSMESTPGVVSSWPAPGSPVSISMAPSRCSICVRSSSTDIFPGSGASSGISASPQGDPAPRRLARY